MRLKVKGLYLIYRFFKKTNTFGYSVTMAFKSLNLYLKVFHIKYIANKD